MTMTQNFSPFRFCACSDLIQDWASDSAPDIYSFVPYSWTFKVLLHQFEMIWAANQHNWIDCSTKQQENGEEDAQLQNLTSCADSVHEVTMAYINF